MLGVCLGYLGLCFSGVAICCEIAVDASTVVVSMLLNIAHTCNFV